MSNVTSIRLNEDDLKNIEIIRAKLQKDCGVSEKYFNSQIWCNQTNIIKMALGYWANSIKEGGAENGSR